MWRRGWAGQNSERGSEAGDAFWQLVHLHLHLTPQQLAASLSKFCPVLHKCAHILHETKNWRKSLEYPVTSHVVINVSCSHSRKIRQLQKRTYPRLILMNCLHFTRVYIVHAHAHVSQKQGGKLCCLVNPTYQHCGWSRCPSCPGFQSTPQHRHGVGSIKIIAQSLACQQTNLPYLSRPVLTNNSWSVGWGE